MVSRTAAGTQHRRFRLAIAPAAAIALAAAIAGAGAAEPPVPIAILPFENLSDASAPVATIRASLRERLESRGVRLVAEETLLQFMRQHRVRYVGGLARELGRALQAETGAGAALLTSIDLYGGGDVPRIALSSRLVSAGEETRILWMDSAGRAGDDAPGFLGRGRMRDPRLVAESLTDRLAGSLARHLAGAGGRRAGRGKRDPGPGRFRPSSYYRVATAPRSTDTPVRVAVLPLANDSTTRHAGDIVALQLIRHLVAAGNIEVLEPGVVREALLRSRLIQEEGLSVPQADLLRLLLGADVVLFGEVTAYIESGAGGLEPEIDYSIRAIDTGRRELIWASNSHARGDDRVVFFGLGRIGTAHALASATARAVIGTILPSVEGAS